MPEAFQLLTLAIIQHLSGFRACHCRTLSITALFFFMGRFRYQFLGALFFVVAKDALPIICECFLTHLRVAPPGALALFAYVSATKELFCHLRTHPPDRGLWFHQQTRGQLARRHRSRTASPCPHRSRCRTSRRSNAQCSDPSGRAPSSSSAVSPYRPADRALKR